MVRRAVLILQVAIRSQGAGHAGFTAALYVSSWDTVHGANTTSTRMKNYFDSTLETLTSDSKTRDHCSVNIF